MRTARGKSLQESGRTAEPIIATDMTLNRIETVLNLLLLASSSASSIRGTTTSEHDRLHAAMVTSALDEALAEQRIVWLELAPTVASGAAGPPRYRDVPRHETSLAVARLYKSTTV